ncbi:hypothetical protein MMC19_007009 [Ptychographa xylographoides]|nr:hypothetical protein [Ptychographa xylographoides]
MAFGSQSFATFLILCHAPQKATQKEREREKGKEKTNARPAPATSFFLGVLFSLFPYDYPILWTAATSTESAFGALETHLRTLHASPPLIPRILHIVVATGLLGFLLKLYRPSESNLLFDGASLVLYMVGLIVYVSNIVKGLRVVSSGDYGAQELVEGEVVVGARGAPETVEGVKGIGREDSLRVLSASHTILALVLVGVLVLQAGQWYAERKEGQEVERARRERAEKKGAGATTTRAGSAKKKA